MFGQTFSDLRPSPPVDFATFSRLLSRWSELAFEPRACRESLERWIEDEAIPPHFFSPAEIAQGGLAATDALLYGAWEQGDWRWSLQTHDREVSCDVSAEAVAGIASILRAACTAEDATALAERVDPQGVPTEIYAMLAASYPTQTPHGIWTAARSPGIYRREHASVVICSSTTRVLLDPQQLSLGWTTNDGRYPAERAPMELDAVALTHSHADHWSLASIVAAAEPEETLVVVPSTRPNLLALEDPGASLALAGQRACAPAWGTSLRVGDIEVDVLPFYGEQPTCEAPGCDPRLRNWGNTYRFNCPEFSALVLVDSGVDPMGSAIDAVADSTRRRGPVDVLLSCCQSFPEAINAGLPMYALTLPFARLAKIYRDRAQGIVRSMTLGPSGVAEACRAARARSFLPYAHGFRGIGEDPVSTEGGGVSESSAVSRVAEKLRAAGAETQVVDWRPGDVARLGGGGVVVERESGARS